MKKTFMQSLKEDMANFNGFDAFEAPKLDRNLTKTAALAGMSADAKTLILGNQGNDIDDITFMKSPSGANTVKAQINLFLQPTNGVLNISYGVLFGNAAAMSNYSRIPKEIPNVNIIGTSVVNNENLQIDSQDNLGNATSVIVSGGNVPYTGFLGNLASSKFIINGIRASVNNILYVSQFDQPIVVVARSLFGKGSDNSFTPSSFISPDQNQSLVVDIPVKIFMDKYKSLVIPIESGLGAGLIYKLSMYITAFDL